VSPPLSGWVPGGDCEHLAGGLDRSPVLGWPRCPQCGRHEKLQARLRGEPERWREWVDKNLPGFETRSQL
jgi:hypothetical protein